jgi:hypothetical protein
MKPHPISLLVLVAALGVTAVRTAVAAVDDDLDDAFQRLEAGRDFKKDFPGHITRRGLVNTFLGLNSQGSVDPLLDRHQTLSDAIDRALRVRNNPETSPAQQTNALEIAWEAVEALTDGALMAGNQDLLNGLRAAFPNASGRPGADRPLPQDLPKAANGQEYTRANLINLGYARLHFLRAIKGTLDFMALDPVGALRATDDVYDGEAFKTFTAFNEPNHLPLDRFFDHNYPTNVATTTAAYNYANLLQRFAIANNSMAQRLWHAAFADRTRTNTLGGQRAEMLAKSAAELRRNIHCQYLCSLPVAATLPEADYQTVRMDKAAVEAATSRELLDRITSGEAPKPDNRLITANSETIATQIAKVESNYGVLVTAHDQAKTAIEKWENASTLIVGDARTVRAQFESQLWSISNVHPTNYNHLETAADRRDYRNKVDVLLADRLNRDLTDSTLIDGSELGKAAIAILRATNDLEVARAEVLATPQLIRVLEQETHEINTVIFKSGQQMAAFDIAQAAVEALGRIRCGYNPPYGFWFSHEADLGAAGRSALQAKRTLELASKEARMNNIRTAAEVQKLLIQQAIQVQRLDSLVADVKLASANYQALANQMHHLIEEAGTYQDESAGLWYRDTKLLFQREDWELKFDDALKDYVNSLYLLAKMLEMAWGEPFQNPFKSNVKLPNGTYYGVLGDSVRFDGFTIPESVFAIVDVLEARDAHDALKEWDESLRRPGVRGDATPGERSTTLGISVRQDLLGYSDYDWDEATQQFVLNPERKRLNIRRFRAYLLRRNQELASPLFDFALDFGIRTSDILKRTMTPTFRMSLIEGTGNDWNQRLTRIALNFKGQIYQGRPEITATRLYQMGVVEVPGFFSTTTNRAAARKFDLSQYYVDPLDQPTLNPADGAPALHDLMTGINKDIATVPPTDVAFADWSPYCDRYILAIPKNEVPVPIQIGKLEDIEIMLYWSRGHPKALTWGVLPEPR